MSVTNSRSKRVRLRPLFSGHVFVNAMAVATSFVCKVRKEQLNENNEGELTATRKRKQEHCQRSADPLTQNT
ncbi:hypothetical protein ACTXT7_014680 [Hymenolepis weldensis]